MILIVLAIALLSASLTLTFAGGTVEIFRQKYRGYGYCYLGWCVDGTPAVYFELRYMADSMFLTALILGEVGVVCLAIAEAKTRVGKIFWLGTILLAIHIASGYVAYTVNMQKPEVWITPVITTFASLIAGIICFAVGIKKKAYENP
jgi:hypothetical protein